RWAQRIRSRSDPAGTGQIDLTPISLSRAMGVPRRREPLSAFAADDGVIEEGTPDDRLYRRYRADRPANHSALGCHSRPHRRAHSRVVVTVAPPVDLRDLDGPG